jgi:hypothetical protein
LICIDGYSCFQTSDDVLSVDIGYREWLAVEAMSCVGGDEGIEDAGVGGRVMMVGRVVFGMRHVAAQSTSGRLAAACDCRRRSEVGVKCRVFPFCPGGESCDTTLMVPQSDNEMATSE